MAWQDDNESNRMPRPASIEESTALMNEDAIPEPKHLSKRIVDKFWFPLFCGILVGFLVASSIFLGLHGRRDDVTVVTDETNSNTTLELGSEINRLVPEVQHKTIQFWNDSSFVPTYDIVNGLLTYNDTMEMIEPSWHALFPYQKGFIPVPDPTKYSLPPSADQDVDGEYWSISAFHQVHCLQMIMESWLQYLYGVEQEPSVEHVLHCFDYIRMGLMCAADSALEGSDPFLKARGLNGTQGLGSEHVCRDWEALRDFADRSTRL
ncbi:hypothetical protein T440DRAFT_558401 [Plenodomus tracheiphilus IPT5]|uniref:Oxidase ustYa n=1 Tax=Plenodomus tracheiphilus IPT5 TaxID=1408161 RepID=A0A6A7ASG7_9PLEO|nr:hypothetical protein T440DRAFT_558401 [Plenodomus tracheiphilus IPT5]